MSRDELILGTLAAGATSTIELAERTGLPPSTVHRGLRHLIKSGHVFSPGYAIYRLTALGQTVADGLGSTADEPAAKGRARSPQPARQADDGPSHVSPSPPAELELAASVAATPDGGPIDVGTTPVANPFRGRLFARHSRSSAWRQTSPPPSNPKA